MMLSSLGESRGVVNSDEGQLLLFFEIIGGTDFGL